MNYLNKRSDRFILDIATPNDNREILEILEQNDFKGNIALTYTRRPSPFQSFMNEGEEVIIIVGRDQQKNQLIGFGACAINNFYINGKVQRAGYLFALRSRNEYHKKNPLLHKGYGYLFSLLQKYNIQYYFTTILKDNTSTQKLLEKKRAYMPAYQYFGNYNVYSIKTGGRPMNTDEYTLKKADIADLDAVIDFLQTEGRTKQFFPYMDKETLIKQTLPVNDDNFYIILDAKKRIVAACYAWDQQAYKQYIINSYSGVMKYIYPLSNMMNAIGYPKLPEPGTRINFFTLSFWAVKNNDHRIFKYMLKSIAAHNTDYAYFLIGMHESNSLNATIKKIPRFTYNSRLYLVQPDRDNYSKLDGREIYLECGIL